MTGLPRTRQLWITPLSPVHMGTGEDYVPTQYVIEDDALFEFDEGALACLPDNERAKLDGILRGPADGRMLLRVQAFFYGNREWLLGGAGNRVKVSQALARLYQKRIGQAAQVEAGGRVVQNRLEIARASYEPASRRLRLPGSGLKGAIRTALLNRANGGRAPIDRRESASHLQERLFHYDMRHLHHDPLRLVHIGDCGYQGPEGLNSAEILFAVNRKREAVLKDGREIPSQAENLYQLLECATPFRFRAFHGELRIEDPGALGQDPRLPRDRFDFQDIAQACHSFYGGILARELQALKRRGCLDSLWHRTLTRVLQSPTINTAIEEGRAFLLRVGRHCGADSVTLDGVRRIEIRQGRGQTPTYEPLPKTFWLAAGDHQDRRHLRPFGWVLVEMTGPGETPSPWPEAEDLTEAAEKEMRDWRERVDAVQARAQARLERIRREIREREAAEAEAAAAAEEERRRRAELAAERARERAAFAALPPAQQALARFQRGLARLPDPPLTKTSYPDLVSLVNRYLNEARDWTDVGARTRLADLAESAYDRYGWWQPGTKKDKRGKQEAKKRSAIDSLRNKT